MLPAGQGQGQIWLRDQFLCDVEYSISEAQKFARSSHVQRITLAVAEEHCVALLNSYELTLVLTDGRHYHIPRPWQQIGSNRLECFVESYPM